MILALGNMDDFPYIHSVALGWRHVATIAMRAERAQMRDTLRDDRKHPEEY